MSEEPEEELPKKDLKLEPDFPWQAIAFDPDFYEASPVDIDGEEER